MYNLKVRLSDKMHYLNPVTHLLLAVCKLYVRNIGRIFCDPCNFTKIKQTTRYPSKIDPPSCKGLINKNRSTDGCMPDSQSWKGLVGRIAREALIVTHCPRFV